MSKTTSIQARIDKETKLKAEGILEGLGIPMSSAISMFLRQIVLHKGIPFELKIPNETTVETFRKTDAGEELHRVSGVEELAKELKR